MSRGSSSEDTIRLLNPRSQISEFFLLFFKFSGQRFNNLITVNNDSITLFSSFFPRNIFGFNYFINSSNTLRNNVDLSGNGGSSGRLITSNHDNLNTSRSTFENSVGDSGFGGIDEGDQTTEGETSKLEVVVSRRADIEDSRSHRIFFSQKV